MKHLRHSVALVTGTTSGLGHAAARLLAAKGYRELIITGRSLARVQQTVAELTAETKTQVFTPLELDLDSPFSVHPPSPNSSREVCPSISYCSMQGWSEGRSACSPRKASRPLRRHSSAIID